MSQSQNIVTAANQELQPHTEGMLRQRAATLLTPEAERVLNLRFEPEHSALVIGCLSVPCWLQLAPDGSAWAFGCPWWRTLIVEDKLFEACVLTEVGKVKMHIDGMLEKLDPSKVN
jgi:hypothetical protein